MSERPFFELVRQICRVLEPSNKNTLVNRAYKKKLSVFECRHFNIWSGEFLYGEHISKTIKNTWLNRAYKGKRTDRRTVYNKFDVFSYFLHLKIQHKVIETTKKSRIFLPDIIN